MATFHQIRSEHFKKCLYISWADLRWVARSSKNTKTFLALSFHVHADGVRSWKLVVTWYWLLLLWQKIFCQKKLIFSYRKMFRQMFFCVWTFWYFFEDSLIRSYHIKHDFQLKFIDFPQFLKTTSKRYSLSRHTWASPSALNSFWRV